MTQPIWMDEILHDVWVIDVDRAYPAILEELAEAGAQLRSRREAAIAGGEDPPALEPHLQALLDLDPNKPDRYWAEVVYQFAKLDLRRALMMQNRNPWPREIKMRGDKQRWAQPNLPTGRTIKDEQGQSYNPATEHRRVEGQRRGMEARKLYLWLRGFIPN